MSQQNQPWWASRPQPPQSPMQNSFNFRSGPTFLPGRLVDREEEIKVADVPTNGDPGLFPLSDWSGIIVKVWGNDGQIRSMRYVAEETRSLPQQQPQAQPVPSPIPDPVPQSVPTQPQALTADQVGKMIDDKLTQFVNMIMANQQPSQGAPVQQEVMQTTARNNKQKEAK